MKIANDCAWVIVADRRKNGHSHDNHIVLVCKVGLFMSVEHCYDCLVLVHELSFRAGVAWPILSPSPSLSLSPSPSLSLIGNS